MTIIRECGVRVFILVGMFLIVLSLTLDAEAATLRLSPNTGVYSVGGTFTVGVILNTEGKPINAADGELSFNPRELQVVSVSRASSIFNLWTEEPTFSNAAGTVSFGGGSPSGYKGTAGNIVNVTFKPLGAGTPKVNFKSGSALAADGMGTNVLTGMAGGTYTVSAATTNPEPEYITPPNTPAAPKVTSSSHPDQALWYKEKTARLSFEIPSGVTGIRTLLDSSPSTIPTIVYDELIREKTIEDLDEGVSYFHIQFKNADGWGKITHYRLAVDTEAPEGFSITEADTDSPERTLVFTFEDTSPVRSFAIQIDGKDPIIYEDEKEEGQYVLPALPPGHHTVVVEASDAAGNKSIASYSFTVEAFEKPLFIDYPTRINTEVIPAIKGKTRPNAKVSIAVTRAQDGMLVSSVSGPVDGGDPFTVSSDGNGEFTFIPNEAFAEGVYLVTATARDEYGRMSEPSDPIRIIVERPGYITLGSYVVSALSIIIPLIALVFLLAFGSWYLYHRLSLWMRRVRKEALEAEESLTVEFNTIVKNLNEKVETLKDSRKGKLTRAELDLIGQMEDDLKKARARIAKEVGDIENIVK